MFENIINNGQNTKGQITKKAQNINNLLKNTNSLQV